MGIEQVVSANITVSGVTPTRENFGTPLVLAYHNVGTGSNLVDEFSGTTEAANAGHVVGSLVYNILSKVFAQSPRPASCKVGKRGTPWTNTIDLIPKLTTEGFVYRFRILGEQIAYTVPPAATLASVATGIAAAVTAATGPFAASLQATNHARVVATTPGQLLTVTELQPELWLEDLTSAASVATELQAVIDEDPTWYGLIVDVPSALTITAVAAVMETNRKVYVSDTHDTRVCDGTDHADVCSTEQGLGHMRTYIQFHPDYGAFGSAALLAAMLTTDPGSATWMGKQLKSVRRYILKTAAAAALKAKNCGSYVDIANVGTTLWGQSVGGEFMDIVRGIDWLMSTTQLRVFLLIATSPSVPYTEEGVDQIKAEIRAQWKIAANAPYNLLVPDTFQITSPPVASVDPADRRARYFPNIQCTADVRDAIHATSVEGNLVR